MAPPGRGRRLALVAIATGACGCNLLIDPDRYRGNDGAGDDGGPGGDAAGTIAPGPDGAPAPDALLPDDSDAGPIEPASVAEGQGAGTGGRPVVVVLRGDFEAGAVVRIGDPDLTVEPAVVATDGSMIAVAARFPVDPELDEGASQTYDVFVDEVLVDVITVNGLDEASLSGTVNGADLDARYSSIEVTGNVTFTGTTPVRLVATADIEVGGTLDASGDVGGAAGPGGCGGGGAGSAGGCSVYGGGAGATAGTAGTGGGGGGHATVGGPGAGGGGGGQASGSDFLTPIDEEGGNGGGGGGAGTLGAGGKGGGGGGVLVLAADGTISLDGDVVATGGEGGDGGGALAATGGGSGGGGSGGAVILRASAFSVTSGTVSAVGAAGGDKWNAGGLGADGRTRVDVATSGVGGLTAAPEAVRGPRWADDTPYLVSDDELDLTLYGEPNTQLGAIVESGDPEAVMTNGAGVGTLQVTLERGRNHICALISPTASVGDPEAIQCIYVTYIP